MEAGHTARSDLNLLDWGTVEKRSRLEELEASLAIVGDDGLDCRVANDLELDIEGGRSSRGSSHHHGGKGSNGCKELHFGDWLAGNGRSDDRRGLI